MFFFVCVCVVSRVCVCVSGGVSVVFAVSVCALGFVSVSLLAPCFFVVLLSFSLSLDLVGHKHSFN